MSAAPPPARVPLGALAGYFLRLGTLGFGGPIALAGHMQKDLVEERAWFTREEYLEGLALAQLAPGPLAAQLAVYLGWVRGRLRGATLVGLAFVFPSFLMVLALSAAYVAAGGLPFLRGAFYGIGAAVIAILARSAAKLATLTLGKDPLLWALFLANAIVTAVSEREILSLFLGSGLLVLLVRAAPRTGVALGVPLPALLVTGLAGPASGATLGKVFAFFAAAGAFVFGSGLAIVPFLRGGVVDRMHWLTDRQFLDAVAVAMVTPGPVVITVAFIGYLVAGPAGACLAALGVFFPCWLVVVAAAPSYRRWAGNTSVRAFVAGVTAAAAGAIAGAAFVLGRRAILDLPTLAIALATFAILSVRKVPEPLVVLASGALGILASGSLR